jgi:tetratricopeptide (TPR) repeat protein
MSSPEFLQLLNNLRGFHAEGCLNGEEALATMREFGTKLFRIGKFDEAETIFGDCISRSVAHHGTAFEGSMIAMTKLCEVYSVAKRQDDAERVYQHFFKILAEEVVKVHGHDLIKVQEVVELWKKYGREKDLNYFSDFLHTLQISASDSDPRLAIKASHQFAVSKASNMTFGELDKAQALFTSCLDRAKPILEPEELQSIQFDYAIFLEEKAQKYREAEAIYLELMSSPNDLNAEKYSKFIQTTIRYSKMLFNLGRYEKAFSLLEGLNALSNNNGKEGESLSQLNKARLQLALFYEIHGRNDDAKCIVDRLDFSQNSDTLESLLDTFTFTRIQDGLLPVPIVNPARASIYEELHRSLRGKLGTEIGNIDSIWTAARLPYVLALAQICTRLPAHASEAIPIFDATIRNATYFFGKDHPFTLTCMIEAMEFHIFRLNAKELNLHASLANDISRCFGNFVKAEGIEDHMYGLLSKYYVWMSSVEVPEEEIQKMIKKWETTFPTRVVEVHRLNILLARGFLKNQAKHAEELIHAQLIRSSHRNRTYLAVVGKKVLLDVLLAQLASVKNTGLLGREEAKLLYRQVIGLYRHLYGSSYLALQSLTTEAGAYFEDAECHDLAEALYVETIENIKKDHPDYSEEKLANLPVMKPLKERMERIYCATNISTIYQRAEKCRTDKLYSKAEPLYHTVIRRRTKKLGADAYETLVARNSLAVMLWNTQRYDEAQATLEDCLTIRRGTAGDRDSFTLRILFNLSNIYKYQGRIDKAESCYRECVAGRVATLGTNQKETLNAMYYLAHAIASQHRYQEACTAFEECRALRAAAFGATNASVAEVVNSVSSFTNIATVQMLKRGSTEAGSTQYQDHAAAARYATEALFLYRKMFPNGIASIDSTYRTLLYECGSAQRRAFQLTAAETTLKENVRQWLELCAIPHEDCMGAMKELGEVLLLQNRPIADVLALYQPTLDATRNSPESRYVLVRLMYDLASIFFNCCHLQEAQTWAQEAVLLASDGTLNPASWMSTGVHSRESTINFGRSTIEEKLAMIQASISNPDIDGMRIQRAMILREANFEEEAQWLLRQSHNATALQSRLNDALPRSNVTVQSHRLTWVMPNQKHSDAVTYVAPQSVTKPATEGINTEYQVIRSLPTFSMPVFADVRSESEESNIDTSPLAAISHLPVAGASLPSAFYTAPTASNESADAPAFSFVPSAGPSANAFANIPPPSISSTNNPPVPVNAFFGNAPSNPNAPIGGSLFSNPGGTGLFGSNNPSSNGGSGLFGGNSGGTGLFGQSSTFGQPPAFGQSSTFGQPPAFGQSSTFGQTSTSGGGGLFSGNNQQSNTGGGGLFGGNNRPSTGGSGLFSNNSQPPANAGGGLFSNSSQPTSGNNSGWQPAGGGGFTSSGGSGLFGARPSSTGGSGLFGGNNSNNSNSGSSGGRVFGNSNISDDGVFSATAAPSQLENNIPAFGRASATPSGTNNNNDINNRNNNGGRGFGGGFISNNFGAFGNNSSALPSFAFGNTSGSAFGTSSTPSEGVASPRTATDAALSHGSIRNAQSPTNYCTFISKSSLMI